MMMFDNADFSAFNDVPMSLSSDDACFDFDLDNTDLDRMFEDEAAATEDYDFIRLDTIHQSAYSNNNLQVYNPCHGTSKLGSIATVSPTNSSQTLSDAAFTSTYFTPPPYTGNGNIGQHQRRVSCSPIETDTFSQFNGNDVSSSSSLENTVEYLEALKKLSECMKRTELSRRQVMMQRTQEKEGFGNPDVRTQVFSSIQQQLADAHRSKMATSPIGLPPVDSMPSTVSPPVSPTNMTSSDLDKATIMVDFFSGTRDTLTNELEHSRQQLRKFGQSGIVG